MWGTATAAHQVEGDNRNSDWWAWEHHPDSPVAEPSGTAIDHHNRYAEDIALLAELDLPVYRFSVEWARIEPTDGTFDQDALAHYRRVAETVRAAGMTPMVPLNHFTLPVWLAAQGGWIHPDTPDRLATYCRRVVTELGDLVDWYCTINEPGYVALGYVGALGFPPGTTTMANWEAAIDGLCRGLVRSREAAKEARPEAQVGATQPMIEYETNDAGRPLVEFFRSQTEDRFLEACTDDDFIGVQTYTRQVVTPPAWSAPLTRALTGLGPVRRTAIPRLIRRLTSLGNEPDSEIRTTDMGYEYRPEAIAATVRRAHELFPDKPIIVTEHGIATGDDTERIEFVRAGLAALHGAIDDGVPVLGYIYWSAFDNFEWALGYSMEFGLISVDRSTQARTPKPSAHFLGEVARDNALVID
jgi:beta-glucosidase